MNWSKFLYPVYPIRPAEYVRKEGTKLLIRDKYGDSCIDDTSLPGDTLGTRRLRMAKKGKYPLNKAFNSVRDIIKYNAKAYRWIDSRGTLFVYNKTRYVPLVYKPVDYIKYIEGVGSVVKGVGTCPFTLNFPVDPDMKFIGVLEYDGGHILWDLSFINKKNTRILI